MSNITVCNEVTECLDEVGAKREVLKICNHWNYRSRVILKIGEKEYVFEAEHLEQAIRNACNAH